MKTMIFAIENLHQLENEVTHADYKPILILDGYYENEDLQIMLEESEFKENIILEALEEHGQLHIINYTVAPIKYEDEEFIYNNNYGWEDICNKDNDLITYRCQGMILKKHLEDEESKYFFDCMEHDFRVISSVALKYSSNIK